MRSATGMAGWVRGVMRPRSYQQTTSRPIGPGWGVALDHRVSLTERKEENVTVTRNGWMVTDEQMPRWKPLGLGRLAMAGSLEQHRA